MNSVISGLFNSGQTLGGLSQRINPNRSGDCTVIASQTYHSIQKESILARFKSFFTKGKSVMNTSTVVVVMTVQSGTGSRHKVAIKMDYDPEGALGTSNKAEIYCDCKDFMFRSAYEINKVGGLYKNPTTTSRLGAAIGTAPKHPGGGLCKHCAAAINYVMSNYNQVMGS